MQTPEEAFRQALRRDSDPIAAIREVRQRFGITIIEAKELWLQVIGVAGSLDEHQAKLVTAVEGALLENGP